jgi:hypothetical protein
MNSTFNSGTGRPPWIQCKNTNKTLKREPEKWLQMSNAVLAFHDFHKQCETCGKQVKCEHFQEKTQNFNMIKQAGSLHNNSSAQNQQQLK